VNVEVPVDGGALNQMACDRTRDLGMIRETDVMQAREVELNERLRVDLPHLEVRHACEQNRPGTRFGARSSRRHSECHYGK
jgi:hypothetical protein